MVTKPSRYAISWSLLPSLGILSGLLVWLIGCDAWFTPNGATSEKTERANLKDVPAAIQLSDPQLYARETLINDRRREQDFLSDLLDKSAGATFAPQLH